MILFFIAAAVLLLVVLALILEPLVRRFDKRGEDTRGSVVDLGRNRLAELKAKRDSGDISEEEYLDRVRDLETQVADDLRDRADPEGEPRRGGGRWAGLVVVVAVPLLSGLLYLALGQPRALLTTEQTQTASGRPSAEDIDAMVSRLRERLERNPDNPQGWSMLGRSYMVLNRYAQAAEAFGRLRGIAGDQPDVLVSEATALAMANGGSLSGEPARLVELALRKQPEHAQALWLAATAAYQLGQRNQALEYYRRAEPLMEGEPLRQVQGMIRELTGQAAGQAARGQNTAPADAPPSLEVKVSVSASLRGEVSKRDTVFIFARAVDGPPMPLAVVRKPAAALPVTVTLDDSHAMMPELKLSGFESVIVGARISSGGEATARPGDLEGESQPVSTASTGTVELTIDRVVSQGE